MERVSDILLELLSEEIPARMQAKAEADLARLFTAELAKAGIDAGSVETFATPRRLALIARGLPAETAAVSEETKGPRASAPPQALEGFLRKTGLTREQLQERDGVLYAVVERPGRATADVLADAIPAIVRAFPWPKSMRWGAASLSTESLRWVRPLQGIVALLDDAVVPVQVAGVTSGRITAGHRFHHPAPVTIPSPDAYVETLRAAHVIASADARQQVIRSRAADLAAAEGLSVIPDDGLVAENAGLTEWPVPLLGRFDPDFLQVPREVIQLTLRTNQKYFVCADSAGDLAPAFICVANIDATDGGARIVDGNRRVLAARLSDARFFWEQDLKVPLDEQAAKLGQIVFHEKLGTVADKVERVAKLARWLVEEGIVPGGDPDQAERAARLAKADLVTQMVGEFPELQGIMGGHYARAQGEPDAVADAVRDHYKPVGQGDAVPAAPVTLAVSLADKLDTLAAFFLIEDTPTGSRDPFALRRAALGVIRLILDNGLRGSLGRWSTRATDLHLHDLLLSQGTEVPQAPLYLEVHGDDRRLKAGDRDLLRFPVAADAARYPGLAATGLHPGPLAAFFADRLKVQQREAGVRHDLIDAVFALGGEDDLVRLLARVHALQAFVATEDGLNLLAGYKRAANILKKEGVDAVAAEQPAPSYAPDPAEAALVAALDAAEPRARAAVEEERFGDAMAALASLRRPIDSFFDEVTVNDADPAKRAARLALLARIRAAVHGVADFSRIEG